MLHTEVAEVTDIRTCQNRVFSLPGCQPCGNSTRPGQHIYRLMHSTHGSNGRDDWSPHPLRCRAQVNRIRQSLALIARNSTAFGLVQPHLERTKLCQLGDEALEPKYLRQRSALQQLVTGLAHPKVGQPPSRS
jgi:hypothetical protein